MGWAMKRSLGFLGMGLLVAGCAGGESSGVVALGPDVFVIENRGGILPGVVERSLEEAAAFCASQGAQAEMLTTRVNPQSYQVAFRCMGQVGAVPMAMVPQPAGTPPTATRRRPVLEAGQQPRQRRQAVSAPNWAAQPAADMPAFVAAPAPAPVQPAPAWAPAGSPGNPFMAQQPPPGVAWASPQQAVPFGIAIPGSVYTPPPMPVIQPAPEGTTRRMSARRARAAEPPAPEPALPAAQPAPMMVPLGVPLLPAQQPLAGAAPAQPATLAPQASAVPSPNQIPALGLLPPQGQGAAAPPTPAASPRAALAPVAGPVFQPSANPLPAADAPLSAVPPPGFWQTAR